MSYETILSRIFVAYLLGQLEPPSRVSPLSLLRQTIKLCSQSVGTLPSLIIMVARPGLEFKNFFSCSTQLSMKFQLVIKLKYQQMKKCLVLSLSDVVFIMLINVKMPTIVGILTFMSKINFMLS